MMEYADFLIAGGRVVDPETGFDAVADVYVKDGAIAALCLPGEVPGLRRPDRVFGASGLVVAPGLIDMHVHLRQPGQSHKEDIASGSRAAARGGVTTVLAMPNTSPVADCPEVVALVLGVAAKDAAVTVCPAAAVTCGQEGRTLSDFAALRAAGAFALTDDGRPIRDDALMERAMIRAADVGLPLIDHCEPETEDVLRDIALSRKTGCPIHLAHISRKESVKAIRAARREGLPVTAETCPHYFSFTREEILRAGANAKMNPPLGGEEDRQSVIEGVCDGTLGVISTDHAPHTSEEKSVPFDEAPNGVIGLETLLAAGLTSFFHTGLLSLPALLSRMTTGPARILGLPAGRIAPGAPADLVIFDPETAWRVEASRFASRSRNTPFEGHILKGLVKTVIVDGKVVVSDGGLVV